MSHGRPALDPARSARVLASAGTGKTWTLTARIVRLLLAGADPGGLLALTFTRQAAAEMRQRVAERLQALAFADMAECGRLLREIGAEDDADTRARAAGLLEAFVYTEAPLRAMTLHAFCQDLLTRFALEAQVPAGFTLLEDEAELRRSALDSLLRKAHRDAASPFGQALAALAAQQLSEYEVRHLLQAVFDHRAELWAATEGVDEPLTALLEALDAALALDPAHDPLAMLDSPATSARLQMFTRLLATQGDVGRVKADALQAAVEAQGEARLNALGAALLSGKGEPYAFKPAKSKYTEAQADTAQAHFADLRDLLLAALESQRRAATRARTGAALTLGLGLLDEFAQALARNHQLGFAELEWQTVRLLRDSEAAEWVRYKLDRRLSHILLDEFQDTSPTQWRLLLPLLEEFANGGGDEPRTAFLVGDRKQSIYGFRRAAPELLDIAGDWMRGHLAAGEEQLDESRRSAPAIITFVNSLFADDEGQRIGFTPHRTALGTAYGAVEIAPLIAAAVQPEAANDSGLRNPLTTPLETAEDQRAAEEARWIAARIRQLIDARTPVTDATGRSRPLQAGDVMILARARTHLGAVERALGAAGIPYESATRGTLLHTPLAQDLLALLTVLDAPFRNLELAHALRSPLFSASDDDLGALAAAAQGRSWFAALGTLPDRPALARAAALLDHWHHAARQLPPHDLLDRIVSEGDVLRRTQAARPRDSRAAANLAALLQLALDIDNGRYPTLGGFLRHCRTLADGDGPDEAPPPSDEARVRVMTVHAAKGLEAPAVFLVNAAGVPRPAHAGWRVDWPATAARPRLIVHVGKAGLRDGLSQRLLADQQAREQQEALHLLYVAVTRARQYLFVSAFQSRQSPPDSWHALCRKAVQRLLPAPAEADHLLRYEQGTPPTLTPAAAAIGESTSVTPPPVVPVATTLRPLSAKADPQAARNPAAALLGQAVHAALQHRSEHPEWPHETLAARIRQTVAAPLSPELITAAVAEADAVLAAPALQGFFATPKKAWNEVAVPVPEGNRVRTRVLDRLVDDGETLWVLDYKTHRNGSDAAVLDGARQQLLDYLAQVAQLFPGRVIRAGVIRTPFARWLPLDT